MRYLILVCLFLTGCTVKYIQPIVIDSPEIQQERNARQQEVEYQRQQIEKYNKEIAPKQDFNFD